LKFADINDDGRLDMDNLRMLITERTQLISVGHVSNALGVINPIEDIVSIAHLNGAKVLVDACQSAAHIGIDVEDLDVDFLVFSGHKMLGPLGIGVLYGKAEIIDKLPPFLGGGDMIHEVFEDGYTLDGLPTKFEAGTPNVAGAVALAEAIDYLDNIGFELIQAYEEELMSHALSGFMERPFVQIIGPENMSDRIGVFSFVVDGVHPHDLSEVLNNDAVCIRSGHHCAQPLMDRLELNATARLSLYFYNTHEDIDRFFESLDKAYKLFVGDNRKHGHLRTEHTGSLQESS